MTDIKLGELLDKNSGNRDAIHIAIVPVIAAEVLFPGQRIGFAREGDTTNVSKTGKVVGVVDPFLRREVVPGQRFYMMLLPNTITSLRHEWTHPAFESTGSPIETSRKWIEKFAASIEQTYNRLMDAATNYIMYSEHTYDNAENYKQIDWDQWPEFWTHYEIVTGNKVADKESHPFTCSC